MDVCVCPCPSDASDEWMDGWMTPGACARSLLDEFPRTRASSRLVSSRLVSSRRFVSCPLARHPSTRCPIIRRHSLVPDPCPRPRVVVVAPRSRPRLARSLDGRVVTAYATLAHATTASATYAVVLPGGRRRDRRYPSAIARRVASSSAGSRSRVARYDVSTTDVDDDRARRGGVRVRVRVRVRVGVVGDARG